MEVINQWAGFQGASADETKYDSRRIAKWVSTQRIIAALVVAITLVIILGDGLIIGYKVSPKGRKQRLAPDVHILRHGADPSPSALPASGDLLSEASRFASTHGGADKPSTTKPKKTGAGKLLSDAWADDDSTWQDADGDAALRKAAALKQPKPAAKAGGSNRDAWEAAAADAGSQASKDGAQATSKVAQGKVDGSGTAQRAGSKPAGAAASKPKAAPASRSSLPVSWGILPHSSCDGFFGNGFSEYSLLAHFDGSAPGAVKGAGGGQLRGGKADSSSDIQVDVSAEVSGAGAGDGTVDAQPSALAWCRSHPTLESTFCAFRYLAMHSDRISMSRGGEPLDSVMGRQEDIEQPHVGADAFTILGGGFADAGAGGDEKPSAGKGDSIALSGRVHGTAAHGRLQQHDRYKLEMINSIRVKSRAKGYLAGNPGAAAGGAGGGGSGDSEVCDTLVGDDSYPVIFVTRVEYANLFHTSTDWYNVWQTARAVGLEPTSDYSEEQLSGLTPEMAAIQKAHPRSVTTRIPAHVIFLDGHNASPMDDGWLGLFLSINYAKHFPGTACFARAYYAPFGYRAAISVGFGARTSDCKANTYVRQFGDDFARSFGIEPRAEAPCQPDEDGKVPVLFVRRVHYKAHPRHNGQIVRRLDNEDEIYSALERATSEGGSKIRLVNGLFSSMTVGEQVKMTHDSCLVVGAHGAGLSHILFAAPGTHMLELRPPAFMRPHFIAYSHWAGAQHHDWTLGTSTPPVQEVVNRIMTTANQAIKIAEPAAGA